MKNKSSLKALPPKPKKSILTPLRSQKDIKVSKSTSKLAKFEPKSKDKSVIKLNKLIGSKSNKSK